MKITQTVLSVIILLMTLSSCTKENDKPAAEPFNFNISQKATQVINSSNNFGVNLFAEVAATEEGNFMLSPLSASIALTMALNGADGATLDQMKQALDYPMEMSLAEINASYKTLVEQLLKADPKVKLAIANALFYRNGFSIKPPFLNTIEKEFGASVKGLDFDLPSALTTINKWAADNTQQKIPKVIDEISREAMMFIMNAVYFKGDWSYQFDKSFTADKPFYVKPGNAVNVKTMTGKVGAVVNYANGYSVLELPYGRKNFSMVIVLPQAGLEDFYATLTPAMWNSITSRLNDAPDWNETQVIMPKFTFDYEKILNHGLQAMGIHDAFSPSLANFNPISDQDLYISFVKQNTFVDVNEEGTEAAAVTTIGFEATSVGGGSTPVFVVDKPFIFAIRERTTNTLLFIGSVVNPE
jgi:serpin B